MSAHTSSYIIAAISNSGQAPETSYRSLQSAAACPAAPHGEMFKLEVPSLMVGTLDSLMTLSDELGKTDSVIESIVRKVEKSSLELAGKKATELTVGGGVPTSRYIQQFAWDYAKYPNRRPLKELVSLIATGVTSIDDELKQLSTSYGDKQAALQDAKRKKGGNLLSVDLNDVLDAKIVNGLALHDTEYLKTIFVGVPKASKEMFEKEIYTLGSELVGYGGKLYILFVSLLLCVVDVCAFDELFCFVCCNMGTIQQQQIP
jgi:V-type H+-transporting ATPase subunit C